jgi:Ser/Thr protein kinase RdoA (MazF antagonist)
MSSSATAGIGPDPSISRAAIFSPRSGDLSERVVLRTGRQQCHKARLLVRRYHAARPLDATELAALPLLARGSALLMTVYMTG